MRGLPLGRRQPLSETPSNDSWPFDQFECSNPSFSEDVFGYEEALRPAFAGDTREISTRDRAGVRP